MMSLLRKHSKYDWYVSLERIQFVLLVVFSFMCVLYYFFRFQFNMQVEVPIFLYSLIMVLIVASLFLFYQKKEYYTSELDKVILLFFLYNCGLALYSWYLYGFTEFLYSIKNYLTGFIIYVIISYTLPYKYAWKLFLWATFVLLVVALVYLAEYARVHFLGEFKGIERTLGAAFTYTIELDKYAYSLGAPHGIAMPWYQGENQIWVRLPGPLAYPNITGLAVGFGLIITFCMFVVRYYRLQALLIGSLFLLALFATGGRTAIVASIAGILAIACVNVKDCFRFVMVIIGLLVVIFAAVVFSDSIDVGAVSHLFSWQVMRDILSYLFETEVWRLFITNISDYILVGQGYYPVTLYLDAATSGVERNLNIGPILTTDLYFVQVLTTYGILPSIIFLVLLLRALWLTQKSIYDLAAIDGPLIKVIFFSILGFTVAGIFSTLHANAMGSPQLLPLTMLFFGILSCKCKGNGRASAGKHSDGV